MTRSIRRGFLSRVLVQPVVAWRVRWSNSHNYILQGPRIQVPNDGWLKTAMLLYWEGIQSVVPVGLNRSCSHERCMPP